MVQISHTIREEPDLLHFILFGIQVRVSASFPLLRTTKLLPLANYCLYLYSTPTPSTALPECQLTQAKPSVSMTSTETLSLEWNWSCDKHSTCAVLHLMLYQVINMQVWHILKQSAGRHHRREGLCLCALFVVDPAGYPASHCVKQNANPARVFSCLYPFFIISSCMKVSV